MVQGQLEALGTSEHLKQKFGGGYDLVLRLSPLGGAALPNEPKRENAITEYVLSMYPDADFISDNGGLLTYRVPRESIHVGKAFAGKHSIFSWNSPSILSKNTILVLTFVDDFCSS